MELKQLLTSYWSRSWFYLRIWYKKNIFNLQGYFLTWVSSLLFLLGKLVRFGFVIYLIYVIFSQTTGLVEYTLSDLITFYLIFNLFDSLGQMLFRGVYFFRSKVNSGQFDFILLQPINPLWTVLTDRTDWLDLPMVVLFVIALVLQAGGLLLANWLLFLALLVAAMMLITSIHILIAVMAILMAEADHLIWIYRDLSKLFRIPADLYVEPVRLFFIYVLPLALIFTFPAKAWLGLLTSKSVLIILAWSTVILAGMIKLWNLSLTRYSGASD